LGFASSGVSRLPNLNDCSQPIDILNKLVLVHAGKGEDLGFSSVNAGELDCFTIDNRDDFQNYYNMKYVHLEK
jgi:hypothetical protein